MQSHFDQIYRSLVFSDAFNSKPIRQKELFSFWMFHVDVHLTCCCLYKSKQWSPVWVLIHSPDMSDIFFPLHTSVRMESTDDGWLIIFEN